MLREKNGPQLFIIQAEVPHRNENKYKNDLNNRSSWSCQSKYFSVVLKRFLRVLLSKRSRGPAERSRLILIVPAGCVTPNYIWPMIQSVRVHAACLHTHTAALSLWSADQSDHPCSENPTLNALSIHFHILFSFRFKSRMLLAQA